MDPGSHDVGGFHVVTGDTAHVGRTVFLPHLGLSILTNVEYGLDQAPRAV